MGPTLFTLYVSHLFNILSQHLPSIHGYADDTQIDLSFRPSSIHSDINAVCVSEGYIADVRSWFIANRLMINDAKTVFLITFAIYTTDKLKTANVISDDFCHLCKSEQHTIQHMWHDSHGSTRLVISKVDLSPEVDSHK